MTVLDYRSSGKDQILSSNGRSSSMLLALSLAVAIVSQSYYSNPNATANATGTTTSSVVVQSQQQQQQQQQLQQDTVGYVSMPVTVPFQIAKSLHNIVPYPVQQLYQAHFSRHSYEADSNGATNLNLTTSSTIANRNGSTRSTIPFWERETLNGGVLEENARMFGPCYLPNDGPAINANASNDGNSTSSVSLSTTWLNPGDETMYPEYNEAEHHGMVDANSVSVLSNTCKPGYLIIGAGKAGTSSLYKYLVAHDRVLPAKMKQVQFFKYHYELGMKWYLSHFPTAKAFLSSGALLTGEAAPGYLPYPDVAARTQMMMPGSKLLLLVREPIDRAWSSYNYNYYIPGLKKLKEMPEHAHQSDEYLTSRYLYSFEDMIRAEINMLNECMKPGGVAETEGLKQSYWANSMMISRHQRGLPPMVDIINGCYGTDERRALQWGPLRAQNPDGLLDLPNVHRWEGMLGRGLYAVQAEWWYTAYPNDDIHMICSNEMKVDTVNVLNSVTEFLGLPEFEYSDVVSQGMYNVRGHEGYDKLTSWDSEKKEKTEDAIPLSDVFREELNAYVNIHNERLFSLVGKRCSW